MNRSEIESAEANGNAIVQYGDTVLQVNPGGALALLKSARTVIESGKSDFIAFEDSNERATWMFLIGAGANFAVRFPNQSGDDLVDGDDEEMA